MKKVLLIIVAVILAGVFVWTLIFLYNKSQEKPVSYNTQKATYSDIVQKTLATGSIVPRKEIAIKPVVSGVIEKIFVVPGQQVKAGDVLARVKIIPDMLSLNNAENRVKMAEISNDNVEIEYKRMKALYEQGVIAYADFQPIELSFKNAEAELAAAKDNLQIIKEGASKKNSATSNTLIRSTIDGMVLDVPVEEGNSVIEANNFNEGTTIAAIADMSDLIFEGQVDESEVGKIKEGMSLILSIGAIESEKYDATLEYISPKGLEENGAIQFEIKAAVKLKENQFIRAGYSANADIVLDRRDSVLAISEGLLQFEEEKPFVEIKTGEQEYSKKFVKLGLSDGMNVEVLEGVSETDDIKAWNQPITGEEEEEVAQVE